MKNGKKSMNDVLESEMTRPLGYQSDEDFTFVNALMRYFDRKYLKGENSDVNITNWWRQRVFTIRNQSLSDGESCLFPDAIKGKCFVETYVIDDETQEQWEKRKKVLLETYAGAIAAYHESAFAAAMKRISPEFRQAIIGLNKTSEGEIN